MGWPDLGVKDARPRSVAAEFHTASSEGKGTAKLDDPVAAAKAHGGWTASAASDDCVAEWSKHLHELGKSARAAAGSITKAMDEYAGTDRSIEAGLRQGAAALEGA
ncbi:MULTISPECIES: hypothetical protein [Streptomyces]|uniref:hypothetical protein n=1 Tax=Streptomyces TaxID=1883 RepID=UPI00163BD845|nr:MULTISPECIES: hypothetical protein [Streptomyces]MBC2878894.1 hypothetical protein [Streptomyces sp. TYQ1024]UBI38917.1 hypothetical protein K7I03_22330 [Streptomyces mobaraensis]UKW31497.1 hypothetical protein MCU78_22275 [Streptomyces sp. TYQ1024]